MNAGKTTMLLQTNFNYRERGMTTLLFTPLIDNRFGPGVIHSRIGIEAQAIVFDAELNLFDHVNKLKGNLASLECVLIDEVQFMTKAQVLQLADIVDILNIPVLAYGLRTDFRGEPFEGSLALLLWADELIEIKTICHCGRKATMTLRIDKNLKPIGHGVQIEIGGNDRYVAVCRRHFKKHQLSNTVELETKGQ
jgi:thymidine kinase